MNIKARIKLLLPVVLLYLFSGYAAAGTDSEMARDGKTYIFINSDIDNQQVTINHLNNILLQAQQLENRVYLIDIAEKAKDFRGEITYVHDKDGTYVGDFMPREIPEVVEVFRGKVVQHYRLDFYGLKLLNALVVEYQENNDEK
ncbi:hypothetical protein BCU68_01305 [Vibrio sp. 10N.286.49.B3]|uniref:hypothetical protein n=1 Tax=Vibrio sp. 10N.286.49.B3 TaxID=1880855 RepID=UPI000C81B68A|nr:hypothetical protein [Vibrio sp. 10N.286.49.B3]PMH46701.1 hypothetical protein BCU68_01305 [Vibrio sp. 10N.286.49.B3]